MFVSDTLDVYNAACDELKMKIKTCSTDAGKKKLTLRHKEHLQLVCLDSVLYLTCNGSRLAIYTGRHSV